MTDLHDRAGVRLIVDLVSAAEGAPRRIVVDWLSALADRPNRHSRVPVAWTQDFVESFLGGLPASVVASHRAAVTTLRAAAAGPAMSLTGAEFAALTVLRSRIHACATDSFGTPAAYLQPADAVTRPGEQRQPIVVRAVHVRGGTVVVSDAHRMLHTFDSGELVNVERPDPTFRAPSSSLLDRRGKVISGLHGCSHQAGAGICLGSCGRAWCVMESEVNEALAPNGDAQGAKFGVRIPLPR